MASNFSRPSMRNFSRQSSPPAGVTNKNMPPPSASLIAFAAGFAFRIATSVGAIFSQPFRGFTQRIPPGVGVSKWPFR